MPPKAKAAQPSKKADQKKKEKVIEDKTFGLKNKKGAKMQKYVQQVEKQVKQGNNPAAKRDMPPSSSKDKKEQKRKEEEELRTIFKPVMTQKLDRGVDPKSVLCMFFKQGVCSKGDKCKFSHDPAVGRKSEKRSLYVDVRDGGAEADTDDWDENKYNEVAASKHGEADMKKPKTANVCKHFLEAVENKKFGWFWTCPNGDKCIYRHALPPGYVLKRDKKKEEKKEEISMEDLVERERALLGVEVTKVTLETFLLWKKRKLKEKEDAAKKEEDKKRADFKSGRNNGLSGRDMFTFNPDLVSADNCDDGDEAFDTSKLSREDGEEEEERFQFREIILDTITSEAREADNSGTVATADRLKQVQASQPEDKGAAAEITNGEELGASCPIDENLFVEDDDDLAELEDEINELDLDDIDQ